MNNPEAGRGAPALASTPPLPITERPITERDGRDAAGSQPRLSGSGAWSPNPTNPPKFFEAPVQKRHGAPGDRRKLGCQLTTRLVDQYVPNLKKYRAIMMDVGLQDNLAASNKQMEESLTRLGVVHTFETDEGNHGNRVKERFETKALPFFSKNLEFQATRGSR